MTDIELHDEICVEVGLYEKTTGENHATYYFLKRVWPYPARECGLEFDTEYIWRIARYAKIGSEFKSIILAHYPDGKVTNRQLAEAFLITLRMCPHEQPF
jgi:hypothetical protein